MKPKRINSFASVPLLLSAALGACTGRTSGDDTSEVPDNEPQPKIQISAGGYHTCGITQGGTVKCWGYNNCGQAGGTTGVYVAQPSSLSGFDSRVVAVSSGKYHNCALTEAGTVGCWGSNASGELGNGFYNTVSGKKFPVPFEVQGLPSRVVAVSAGGDHTCALTDLGAVFCWGYFEREQSGVDIQVVQTTAAPVTGLEAGVTAISAGGAHTCALMDTRNVKCWGNNGSGELGNGTTDKSYNTPVLVEGLHSVESVSAGVAVTCALTISGGVKCWGSGHSGAIGDDDPTGFRTVPTQVSGLDSGVIAISIGTAGSCALTYSGQLLCWGRVGDGYGCTGDIFHREFDSKPTPVPGLESGVVGVSMGGFHRCALLDDDKVVCWGANDKGQLGDGTTTCRLDPVEVVGFP